jgi:hypothetical protein
MTRILGILVAFTAVDIWTRAPDARILKSAGSHDLILNLYAARHVVYRGPKELIPRREADTRHFKGGGRNKARITLRLNMFSSPLLAGIRMP